MKLLEKVKNMFTEEIEDEEPIKKEVIQVEIKAPEKKEEPKVKVETPAVLPVTENETLKKEEKFKFPVYFDESDFDKIETRTVKEPPKSVPKKSGRVENGRREVSRKVTEPYGGKNPAATIIKEEKKVFKPTPIISPVYGILDKNYKKEDIIPKRKINSETYSRSRVVTIDDVRNKAYGPLEEAAGMTGYDHDSSYLEEDVVLDQDLFDDLKDDTPRHGKRYENGVSKSRLQSKEIDLLEEVNDLSNIAVKERGLEDDLMAVADQGFTSKKIEDSKKVNMIEEEMEKIIEQPEPEELTESDLFNLIDSMYEKKEDE